MAQTPAAYVQGLSDAAKIVFDAFQQIIGGGLQATGARDALKQAHRQIVEKRSDATDNGVVHTDVLLNETKLALDETERMLKVYKEAHADLRTLSEAKNKRIELLVMYNVYVTIWALGATIVAMVLVSQHRGWFA